MPLQKTPKNIPSKPGVYLFKNEEDEILYIGKAKDLKKRVGSYFHNKQHAVRTKKMLSKAEKVDYFTVNSELEAIVLESNLIKEHQPKYNVIMKDDKSFVYIRVSTNEDFPRISIVRKIEKDGAKYFGPKSAGHKAQKTLKFLKKIFPYRHCGLNIEFLEEEQNGKDHKVKVTNKVLKYPCIDYFIKRCPAPCIGKVKPEEYAPIIKQVTDFLEGNTKPVLEYLEKTIKEAAALRKFEKAAQLRDKYLVIKDIAEKQIISGTQHEFFDILGLSSEEDKAFVTLLQIRDGKLINQESFTLKNEGNEESEILEAFIRDYYQVTSDFPKEILSDIDLANSETLEIWLKELAEGKTIKISSGKRSKRRELVELARENAKQFLKQQKTRWEEKEEPSLQSLQEILKLKNVPKRIEGYDISHLGGTNTVGSMVVFENGLPKKNEYRIFNIKQLENGQIDDFASLHEVFGRRLARLKAQIDKENAKKKYSARKLIKKFEEQLNKYIKNENQKISEDTTINILLDKKGKIQGFIETMELDEKILQILQIHISKMEDIEILKGMLIEKVIKDTKSKKIYTSIDELEMPFYETMKWRISKKPPDEVQLEKDKIAMLFEKNKATPSDSFQAIPDLMLVDGGKGQLKQLSKVLKEYKLNIAIASLAKKEEEIFIPEESTSLIIEKNNPGLQLLQRVRDESHRFALKNQRARRKSDMEEEFKKVKKNAPT